MLFFEAASALDEGPRAVLVLLCSFSAATLAVP
jgi:hypothetical protein